MLVLSLILAELAILSFSVGLTILRIPRDIWYNLTCPSYIVAATSFRSYPEWVAYKKDRWAQYWNECGIKLVVWLNFGLLILIMYLAWK